MTNAGFLKRTALCGLLCVFVFVSAATGIGWLFRLWQFPETNIVVVYILSVVVTARCTGGIFGAFCPLFCLPVLLTHFLQSRISLCRWTTPTIS